MCLLFIFYFFSSKLLLIFVCLISQKRALIEGKGEAELALPTSGLYLVSFDEFFSDFPDEFKERLVDVNASLRAGLEERAPENACELGPLGVRDLALVLEIALVSAEDHRNLVGVLYAQDLLAECADLVEAAAARDSVNEEEPLAGTHVLVAHRRVLLLSCRVEDVEKRSLSIDCDLLPVTVFDSRIILLFGDPSVMFSNSNSNKKNTHIDEMILDELDRQCALANTSTTNNDNLVLGHFF